MKRLDTQLLLLLAWLGSAAALAQDGATTRVLPVSAYNPGQALTLTVEAAPVGSTIIYAVEEDVPANWTVDAISHGGRFNTERRKVTWGPFLDNLSRSLTVRLTPPGDARGRVTFAGYGSFNGIEVVTSGPSELDSALLGGGTVTRALPLNYRAGQTVTVSLNAAPTAAVYLYLVEESCPAGWEVVAASDGGAPSASARSIKWGPFMDATARSLTYTLRAPTGTAGMVNFSGQAIFNSNIVPTTGDTGLAPAPNPSGLAARVLPSSYQPSQDVAAAIQVVPETGVSVYAVEETVPTGWGAAGMSEGGVFVASSRTVKWGPFVDGASRTLTYTAQPPANAHGLAVFGGGARFDAADVAITGMKTLPEAVQTGGTASRQLPANYQPLSPVTVTLQVSPKPGVKGYGVEETYPSGWTLDAESITEGGVAATGSGVKWLFLDHTERTLSYQVRPPAGVRQQVAFSGRATFDAVVVTTTGASVLEPGPASDGTVQRTLPGWCVPGQRLVVRLDIAPAPGVAVYAVEETLPAGWVAENVSDGGSFTASDRLVKWPPVMSDAAAQVSYEVVAPVSAQTRVAFAGRAYFGSVEVATGGSITLPCALSPGPGTAILNSGSASWAGAGDYHWQLRDAIGGAGTGFDQFNVDGTLDVTAARNFSINLWTLAGAAGEVSGAAANFDANLPYAWPVVKTTRGIVGFSAANFLVVTQANRGTGGFANGLADGAFNLEVAGRNLVLVFRPPSNHAPVANADVVERKANRAVKVWAAELLRNDYDADHDTLVLVDAGPGSAKGATVAVDGPWVTYLPPAGMNESDSFTYTISDGHGHAGAGTVTVLIKVTDTSPTRNRLAIDGVAGTPHMRIRFVGIPGWGYQVQATTDLTNWINLGTGLVAADAAGLYELTDTDAGLYANRYYRAIHP
jgi:hypothetical protein